MVFAALPKSHFPKQCRNHWALSCWSISGTSSPLPPDCLTSFSLVHTCSMPSNALILTGHWFFLVCDFVKLIVFRICFLVAFTLFRKAIIFKSLQKKSSHFAKAVWSNYIFFCLCLTKSLPELDFSLLRKGKRNLHICYSSSILKNICLNIVNFWNFWNVNWQISAQIWQMSSAKNLLRPHLH